MEKWEVNEWFHISHSGKCFNHSCLGNGKWNVQIVFVRITYAFNSYWKQINKFVGSLHSPILFLYNRKIDCSSIRIHLAETEFNHFFILFRSFAVLEEEKEEKTNWKYSEYTTKSFLNVIFFNELDVSNFFSWYAYPWFMFDSSLCFPSLVPHAANVYQFT